MPISIALVITDLRVGGAERALVELASRLDRRRFNPVVYCLLPAPVGEEAALVRRLSAAGIRTEFLNARGWWSLPRVVGTLWRRFSRDRPQLVQAFLFHANVIAALAARLAGVPVMVSGIRVADPRPWHLRLARWTDCLVRRHVCVSRAVSEYAVSVGGLPQEKLVVIPNGVEADRFSNARPIDLRQLGLPPGGRAVTFVGRLESQKGLDGLLESCVSLFTQVPDAELLLVGDGPARAQLARAAQGLRLEGRVHFAGWQADVPGILAASEVLVLPSRWEGMPNVVLEAMAAGKPVVASDVQGVRELLGPNAEAQTAPSGDGATFLAKLVFLLANPPQAAELGEKNRRRAKQEFGIQAMVSRYESLYSSLLPSAVLPPPDENL